MKESAVMKKRRNPVSPVIVVIYVFLVLLAVLYLAPLLWMLSVSLKDNAGVMAAPFALPEVFHWENYSQAWSLGKLGVALANSTLVCGVTLLISLFFGAMAAFAIARMRWKLAEAAHTFFLIGMMVPVHCILPDASVYHIFTSDDDLSSDRIFQIDAGRADRGCSDRWLRDLPHFLQNRAAAVPDRTFRIRPYDVRR